MFSKLRQHRILAAFVVLWASVASVQAAESVVGATPTSPAISAASAIVIDSQSGQVLFAKDQNTVRFPASTTKILTALLLLERTKPDDIIIAPEDVETITDASLHLRPGEQVKASEMLYAILLRSANDACYATAVHIAGSVEKFSQLMTERAKEIGCKRSEFANPHGLHDPKHFSTAYDLALIAREAMKRHEFREVARTRKHQITRSVNQEDLWLISKNKWLKREESADGIKTGYTVPAGRCFVGSATRDGNRLISVVLKSDDWLLDTETLLSWAFSTYERREIAVRQSVMGTRNVKGSSKPSVQFGSRDSASAWVSKNSTAEVTIEYDWPPETKAPVAKGAVIGTAHVSDGGSVLHELVIVALEDAPEKHLGAGRASGPLLIVLALGGTAYIIRRRARTY